MRTFSESLPDDLGAALALAGPALAGRLHYRAEVDSTNDEAQELAAAGAPDGTAVVADLQHAGRGRRGRSWVSPPGAGLYLSVVVRPCTWPGGLGLLTLGAGVAAARAVARASGLPVELKWPNDLVVGRPWRKLGGVLSEAVGGSRLDAVVVGIGINLRRAAYPPEVAARATSIEDELGRAIDRGALAVAVLVEFDEVVSRLRAGEAAWMAETWRRLAASGLGRAPVRWQDRDGWRTGAAVDIDDDGALVVERDGRRERIVAGEVIWERVRA
ncbi:MAG TPA: biotin--[acetyl-CoA-carboxylase] ligase [Vicinamibacterales bacterium]|nr:biotin--[acetyl-CoA-carboxylase] ligase [Vicinamibacterales bacterium]